jgi:hypothetical protein
MESIVFDGSSRCLTIKLFWVNSALSRLGVIVERSHPAASRPRRKSSFFSSATIALEVFAAARWNTLNVGHVQLRFSTFEVAGR